MVTLPRIPYPERYAGLYVYDFGDHVSVGYTALEIRYLRESAAHRHGAAYEIYRVAENGSIELRGATDQRLTVHEAMCFLRHEGADARRDYDALLAAARHTPLPCAAEMRLARVYDFDPPNVTALLYAASASGAISSWLTQAAVAAGDLVVGGIEAHRTVVASGGMQIAACELPTTFDLTDRTAEEVLRQVREPLQR